MCRIRLLYNLLICIYVLSNISCESQFIYHPDKTIISTPKDIGLKFESVVLDTRDGIKISAWWIPSNKEKGVVLFCHGNAGNISHRLETIRIFNSLGLSIFIFDYRGFGTSTGSPSEEGTYIDVEESYEYLVNNRKINPGKIIAWGRSLGGAVAARLAIMKQVRFLVLESSFTSVADVSEHHLPILPSGLFFGDCYNTLSIIKEIRCPILIVHSAEDEVIPYWQGVKLYKYANGPKEFINISGSHNGGFMKSYEVYIKSVNNFMTRFL